MQALEEFQGDWMHGAAWMATRAEALELKASAMMLRAEFPVQRKSTL